MVKTQRPGDDATRRCAAVDSETTPSRGRWHILCAVFVAAVAAAAFTPHDPNASVGELEVPTIDIRALVTGNGCTDGSSNECAEVARQIRDAVSSIGMFRVTNHSISRSFQGESGDAIRRLFQISDEEKQRLAVERGKLSRGYIGMGSESGSQRLEVKEAWSYGYEWAGGGGASADLARDRTADGQVLRHRRGRTLPSHPNVLQGPNVWPASNVFSKRDRTTLQDLYTQLVDVAEGLVRGFSMAMGEPAEFLARFCRDASELDSRGDGSAGEAESVSETGAGATISLLRLFHYFPYSRAGAEASPGAERIGSSPHTDWGFLTLILETDAVPGLQVFHRRRRAWFDVRPAPGTIIVNVGDYFSLLTESRFHSPLHRVVSNGAAEVSFARSAVVLRQRPCWRPKLVSALVRHACSPPRLCLPVLSSFVATSAFPWFSFTTRRLKRAFRNTSLQRTARRACSPTKTSAISKGMGSALRLSCAMERGNRARTSGSKSHLGSTLPQSGRKSFAQAAPSMARVQIEFLRTVEQCTSTILYEENLIFSLSVSTHTGATRTPASVVPPARRPRW